MAETPSNASSNQATYWLNQIEAAESDTRYKNWLNAGKQFYERYRLEAANMYMSGSSAGTRPKRMTYNLLWSNVQTMLPMLYSRLPEPYVSRRFYVSDQTARMAGTIAERATAVDLDRDDFDEQAKAVALDFAVVGRGSLRATYESSTVNSRIPIRQENREDGEPRFVTEAGDEIPKDMVERDGRNLFVLDPQIIDERAPLVYQNWQDHLIGPGRKWSEVQKKGWNAWRNYMTKADVARRFGQDAANSLSYNYAPFDIDTDKRASKSQAPKLIKMAAIYEIWDARSRQIFWVSKGYDQLLDKQADFLDLEGFFNTPRPLRSTFTNDTMVPVPDYAEILTQATELDQITAKIEQVVEDIRAGGVFNGNVPSLGQALNNKGGKWTPIQEWQAFAQGGGMQGAVQNYVTQEQINIVRSLYEHRAAVKRDADEMSGMIDLFRGQQTQQDETLGQSEIRKSMGGLRINDKQREFQRYLRDALRLKSEIVVTRFDPDRILEMADLQSLIGESPELSRLRAMAESPQGKQALQTQQGQAQFQIQQQGAVAKQMALIRQALAMLQSDRMRTFKLDIETDATVAVDEVTEKAQASEFIKAVGDFLNSVMGSETVAGNPAMRELSYEFLMYLVRQFHVGRSLEQKIDQAVRDMAAQPPPQPQPDAGTLEVQRRAKEDQWQERQGEQKLRIDAFEAGTDRLKAQSDALTAAKDSERKDVETMNKILDSTQDDLDRTAGNA